MQRYGELRDVIGGAGLYTKWPFADAATCIDKRASRHDNAARRTIRLARRAAMMIIFGEGTTMQGATLRTHAIVDGRDVECKADMEVIAELDEQAKNAGVPIGKNIAAIANSLRPFFVRKIENGSFDDADRASVTLQVHEMVTFMQGHSDGGSERA